MKLTLTVIVLWVLALGASAQMIGVTIEVDTVFGGPDEDAFDPAGELEGYSSYLLYANFTNPTDVLAGIYADFTEMPSAPPLSMNAPCGCFDPDSSSLVISLSNHSALWNFPPFDMLEYDTFWTIGKLSQDALGQTPFWFGGQGYTTNWDQCEIQVYDGGVFVLPDENNDYPINAKAGDDLRIVIGRITTCGDFTFTLNATAFVEGDVDSGHQVFSVCEGDGENCEETWGCMDAEACNFNPVATINHGCAEIDSCGVCGGAGAVYECGCSAIIPGACDCSGNELDALGICGGTCVADIDADGICDDIDNCVGESGCTDDGACNFLQCAACDDGSCDYSCCPGPACCGEGMFWNWEIMQCAETNPADINNDGCVQLNDLLSLLGAYSTCGVAENHWECGIPLTYQGYEYSTLRIGGQCWFAENLRSEEFQNGDVIASNLNDDEWSSTDEGAVAVYGESPLCSQNSPDIDACDPVQSLSEYGRLYNGYSVEDERGLCPDGWRVPTDLDWTTMTNCLGGTFQSGAQLPSQYGWFESSPLTNSNGFDGLPGGMREVSGSFSNAGELAHWWSSTPPWTRTLDAFLAGFFRSNENYNKQHGFSVRCVMDIE